ncbi:PREDICTED: COBRA-like protein 10 [Ipomoea nil]|uniref:COBRA-like protein 10 n=1 Tax=Ipomoea nil TaxID=35883 RepID=UPI00090128A7|nr:PREDICTED: COBRA-like protein 10 [Ipomoea nil]
MRISWRILAFAYCIAALCYTSQAAKAAKAAKVDDDYDYDEDGDKPAAPPPEQQKCDGIFLTYSFQGREKIYPLVKNTSAQAWSFKATLSILNAGKVELKNWKAFVGFQYRELLVSAEGAVVVDGDDFPIKVGKNGTVFAGDPMTDLKTAIDTAGDFTQMQAQIEIKGTQFGLKEKSTPMPRSIKLRNDGFKCPASKKKPTFMSVCCKKDPKFKPKKEKKTKFLPKQAADLSFTYDVLSAYENKYQVQVTIDNDSPLGRLDQWNLTWQWMRNEFIYTMKGAFPHVKDPSQCIYGPQGKYYQDFDFTNVLNCQPRPVISDLPPQFVDDKKIGKLPFCCRNGTLLPKTMNKTKSKSIFQMEVFKLPPDLNRTAITPPQKWKITGRLNPTYKCGPPMRIDPSEFPDPMGTAMTTTAVASWQIACNINKPKRKEAKCCVSFSAYYADSVVPCNTCACGCEDGEEQTAGRRCNQNADALPLPAEALLVPFDNRTEKALAWASMKHHKVPRRLPCPDNCGVSINWHVDSDYRSGWTARMTLFNWGEDPFVDWFTAIRLKRSGRGFENVYSFNGTMLPRLGHTIFMQGLPGLNYLVGEVNGTHPGADPRIPGKQQSVISFLKKGLPHLKIRAGDGFPSKVIFNGEECALPTRIPKKGNSAAHKPQTGFLPPLFIAFLTFLL